MDIEKAKIWVELAGLSKPERPCQHKDRDDPNFDFNKYWYIPMADPKGVTISGTFYLHSDGIMRDGTKGPDGFTGWYKTKKEAEQAIEKYYILVASDPKMLYTVNGGIEHEKR